MVGKDVGLREWIHEKQQQSAESESEESKVKPQSIDSADLPTTVMDDEVVVAHESVVDDDHCIDDVHPTTIDNAIAETNLTEEQQVQQD